MGQKMNKGLAADTLSITKWSVSDMLAKAPPDTFDLIMGTKHAIQTQQWL